MNDNINFKIKKISVDRDSAEHVILLEPSNISRIEDYHYDIRMLDKDLDVSEIDEELHFVFTNDIRDFFLLHLETKISEVPLRLLLLKEAAELVY